MQQIQRWLQHSTAGGERTIGLLTTNTCLMLVTMPNKLAGNPQLTLAAVSYVYRSSIPAANGLHQATVKRNLDLAIKQAATVKAGLSTADALLLFRYGQVVSAMWEAREALLEAQAALE